MLGAQKMRQQEFCSDTDTESSRKLWTRKQPLHLSPLNPFGVFTQGKTKGH